MAEQLNLMGVRQWIDKQLKNSEGKPLLRLFLLGAKGQLKHKGSKPYGFYPKVISAVLSLAFAKWISDIRKQELDHKGFNWFIPEYVYNVREESYLYWELARLSKKLPRTFTYYKWGDSLMYEIDKDGNQIPYHTHASIENTNTFNSFLHEYNFPASPERHAHIMLYLKHIRNPYNLQNFLRSKSINIGDWLRAGYFFVYRELGLTNRWRYDEFVAKPGVYYNWEKIKLAHLLARDRESLYKTLDKIEPSGEDILTFFFWFL